MQLNDHFFAFSDGQISRIFDITTSSGLKLSLFSIGASIQKIAFKQMDSFGSYLENGPELPITLSSSDLEFYRTCPCYAGATLAPNAGRISTSSMSIEQEHMQICILTEQTGFFI